MVTGTLDVIICFDIILHLFYISKITPFLHQILHFSAGLTPTLVSRERLVEGGSFQ